MSVEQPDDFYDIPIINPLTPDEALQRADYRDPRPESDPGFGFWMAVVWCILFFVVTQLVIGIACGFSILAIAVISEPPNPNGAAPDAGQLMKSDKFLIGTLLTVMCSHLGGVFFSWLLLRWQVGRQWKRKIALSRRPTLTHAVLTLIGLVAMLAAAVCIGTLIENVVPSMEDMLKWVGINFPMKGAETMIPEIVKASPLALALFTIGVLPAFDEEFLCRGLVAWGLSFRYPAWAVVLMTSFLFGCLHVDPRQGLGVMFLGIAMHFAYIATRSLWVPMALHFLNNSLSVLHINYADGPFAILDPLENGLKHAPVLFALSSLLLFGAVAFAFHQTRCKLVSLDPSLPVWEPASRSGVELPPPGSGTVVTHDPLSPLSVVLVLLAAVAFAAVLSFA